MINLRFGMVSYRELHKNMADTSCHPPLCLCAYFVCKIPYDQLIKEGKIIFCLQIGGSYVGTN